MRKRTDRYPDYRAFIREIRANGITDDLLNKIIDRHLNNMRHTRELYDRYNVEEYAVPIFRREPRFKDPDNENGEATINNRVNNDFFGEIVDTKVGYFAGKAATYSYDDDSDSVEDTGSEAQVDIARKELSDFVKRSNMYDVNIETTRFASVCGYAGRLLYIDEDGMARARPYPPFETIILSETEITEPSYAVHVYPVTDIDGYVSYKAEFFDENNITFYEGEPGSLKSVGESEMHCFDYCPLQGIPNNLELMGDAEKVIDLIDNYDSNFSDNANDIEGFANAYMVFKNCSVDNDMMDNANTTGVIGITPDDENAPYDVSFLTKNIQDSFVKTHLDRTEDNIYRFSRTPNLNDPEFNASSGIALKLKMTGLETKAAAFEAKQESADRYMFKVLGSSFAKKMIAFDYLQCSIQYNRNFPVDFTGDAQAVQALVAAGLPKQIAFKALSFIDDIDYVMNLIEEEKDGVEDLDESLEMIDNAEHRFKEIK